MTILAVQRGQIGGRQHPDWEVLGGGDILGALLAALDRSWSALGSSVAFRGLLLVTL